MLTRFQNSIEWRIGLLAIATAVFLLGNTFIGSVSRTASRGDLGRIEHLSGALVGARSSEIALNNARLAFAKASVVGASVNDAGGLRDAVAKLAQSSVNYEASAYVPDLPDALRAEFKTLAQPTDDYAASLRAVADQLATGQSIAPPQVASLELAAAKLSDRFDRHSSEVLQAYQAAVADARDRMANEIWTANAIAIITCLLCIVLGLVFLRRFVRPIRAQVSALRRLAAGAVDIGPDVPGVDEPGDIGDMARAILMFRDTINKARKLETEAAESARTVEKERREKDEQDKYYIDAHATFLSKFTEALESFSTGDLKYRLEQPFIGEYEGIRHAFNAAASKIQDAIVNIVARSIEIRGGTDRILSAADELSRHTEEQASSLEETSASMEEMAATIRQNASNAQEASAAAVVTRELAVAGGNVALKAVGAMEKIEKSSRQVTEIVGLIEEIAFQTNILALNAAVEAARAGDAGKGFAVVANEVRALSQRSSRSLKDIKSLIDSSAADVTEGVGLVKQAGGSLTDIVLSVKKVADLVTEIAAASHEQAAGVDQVSRAVANMDEMTQQNAALVQETTASLHSAQTWIHELHRIVSMFDTGVAASDAAMSGAEAASDGNWVRSRQSQIEKQFKGARSNASRGRAVASGAMGRAAALDSEWQEL
ncbi:MAG: methyl-accepting chemotaxis protein [Hyphomicrobium sp.]